MMIQFVPIPDGERLSAGTMAVVEAVNRSPRSASYGTASDLARSADVSSAAVTRAAQSLGFSGWPALQQEIRQRYLSSLSSMELADSHATESHLAVASLRQDRDNLNIVLRQVNQRTISLVARALAKASQVLVVASGSYVGIGNIFVHNARLCGYNMIFASDGPHLTNEMSRLGQDDAILAISFWRPYESTVQAVKFALLHGVDVCVITDSSTGVLSATAGEKAIVVPAEGVSLFPSLTSAMAVSHAVCSEIALVDPAKTRRSVAAMESGRDTFGLLHKERIVGPSGDDR
jgi:DNA-binding MurR/RpiR family transcriptional regulator